jgi:NADPH:quinone reductase-like Zn-dependent oxidoreductase
MTTMKAAILHKNGDPTTAEVVSVLDAAEIPTAGVGEVLVQVKCASMNPVDWKLMKGDFPGNKGGPVGLDVSGVVSAIGPDTTTSLQVGDEIYADSIETGGGSFAEYVRVQAVGAAKKPKNLDFRQAAAMPLAGLTALQGLVTHGGFAEGQTVCILGGSGGVGSLAIQMAKAMGASHIYATGSSVDFIKGCGADTVINYKETNVVEALKGKDLDLIFDCAGGYDGWLAAQGGLKKKGGKFVTIVGDGGSLPVMLMGIAWRKFMSMFMGPAYLLFLTNTKAPTVETDFAKLTELIETGKVKPLLEEKKFELTTESLHEMIKASMSHRTKGKLIMTISK